jgi:chaperonin GroES
MMIVLKQRTGTSRNPARNRIRPLAPAPSKGYDVTMAKSKSSPASLETVEPIGKRVLIRKDEDKKVTKVGIHLPDKMEIPTLTGRVVAVSAQVANDDDYPVRQYDRVLFNPKQAIPVDFEGDNRLFVVPIEDVVAVFRKK